MSSKLPILDGSSPLEDACADGCSPVPRVESKVPMTDTLAALLEPKLHGKEAIFTDTLLPPAEGERVYDLSEGQIADIRARRGAVVDLHPGMGGVAPGALREMIDAGRPLTSLDFMVTKACNFECTWCFAESGPSERDFLPYGVLRELTRDAAEVGVELFILTGGEPLMYRDPALGRQGKRGAHFFRVVDMIRDTYKGTGIDPKILTFDDVALITPEIAKMFAERGVGLCTKGDTLIAELQDYKVNQVGAFAKMQEGYANLVAAGYGRDPALRLVVNSVLDHTTFDGMMDVHAWVMDRGFDHSIVPVHYCGNAGDEDQEAGIHSVHVKVLYDLMTRVDREHFGVDWEAFSAFTYDKTCNRNMSGLHIRANGDITACSESPGREETTAYTFGNVNDPDFSLAKLARSPELAAYRGRFAEGIGTYVCAPNVCDLNAEDLCRGGCAVRSAYSAVDVETGLIVANDDPHNYSRRREDPLCPAWTVLAERQGVLLPGLTRSIHERLVAKTTDPRITAEAFPFEG